METAPGYWRAATWIDGRNIYMHRYILGILDPAIEIDHHNRNALDNRRQNIRVATRSSNMLNRGRPRNNTSGIKGVSWHTRDRTWSARIGINSCLRHLGTFNRKWKAAKAYRRALEQAINGN